MEKQQLTIRLPVELKNQIQQEADKSGISFNAMSIWATQKDLGGNLISPCSFSYCPMQFSIKYSICIIIERLLHSAIIFIFSKFYACILILKARLFIAIMSPLLIVNVSYVT